jgi:hypothetical protein
VEDGLIPSAAPPGALGGHAQASVLAQLPQPTVPGAASHPSAESKGGVTNNYARTEGQVCG